MGTYALPASAVQPVSLISTVQSAPAIKPSGPYSGIVWDKPDPWAPQFDSIVNAIKTQATKDYALNTENGNSNQWSGTRVVDRWVPDFYHDLSARHILYWVKQPPGYTDGIKTRSSDSESLTQALALAKNPSLKTAQTLSKITTVTGYVGTGIAVTAGVTAAISSASVGTGIAAFGAGSSATLSAVPIIGSIAPLMSNPFTIGAGIAIAVWATIAAHHAKAVAMEHINDSAMADYCNKFLDDAYAMIANNQMTVQQWQTYAAAMMKDAILITSPSYKNGNAAWHLRWRLRALLELQYRMVVQSQEQKTQVTQAQTSDLTKLGVAGAAVVAGAIWL